MDKCQALNGPSEHLAAQDWAEVGGERRGSFLEASVGLDNRGEEGERLVGRF